MLAVIVTGPSPVAVTTAPALDVATTVARAGSLELHVTGRSRRLFPSASRATALTRTLPSTRVMGCGAMTSTVATGAADVTTRTALKPVPSSTVARTRTSPSAIAVTSPSDDTD